MVNELNRLEATELDQLNRERVVDQKLSELSEGKKEYEEAISEVTRMF